MYVHAEWDCKIKCNQFPHCLRICCHYKVPHELTYTSDLTHTTITYVISVTFTIFFLYFYDVTFILFLPSFLLLEVHPSPGQSLGGERDRERQQSLWVAEISRHQCYRFNHSQTQTKERQPRGKQTIRPNMFDNETLTLRLHSSHFEVQMTLTDKQACSGTAIFIYLFGLGYGMRGEAWCSEMIRCLKVEL